MLQGFTYFMKIIYMFGINKNKTFYKACMYAVFFNRLLPLSYTTHTYLDNNNNNSYVAFSVLT